MRRPSAVGVDSSDEIYECKLSDPTHYPFIRMM